jgi:hypothetical protein
VFIGPMQSWTKLRAKSTNGRTPCHVKASKTMKRIE